MPAYISIQALFRHVFISGSSGSGKTVMIRTCLLQNLRITRHFREFTIFLMEPHGDLCGEALRFCLNKVRSGKTWWMKTLEAFTGRKVRLNRLVYIDPDVRGTINVELGKDLLTENVRCVLPIFEVKDRSDENELSLVTQELVEALYEIFGVDEE